MLGSNKRAKSIDENLLVRHFAHALAVIPVDVSEKSKRRQK